MTLRPTQSSTYALVQSGLRMNMARLVRAQEQVATGKRILRPSDDAAGTSISQSFLRQIAQVDGWLESVGGARTRLSAASSRLQDASGILTEARSIATASMNGTLSPADRLGYASQLEQMAVNLVEIGNSSFGDRYLFSGTASTTKPFDIVDTPDGKRVVYHGDEGRSTALVGRDVEIDTSLPGSEVFASSDPTGTTYAGLTGAKPGTSADMGTGYETLAIRTGAVTGLPQEGIVVSGDATIIGDHALVVDAAAGTVQLGSGSAVSIETPLPASLEVRDADGSVLTLDLTGWTGVGFSGVATGQGEVSLDGTSWTAFNGTETNLQLTDDASGAVVHVDLTGATRAGEETLVFEGTTNVIDTLLGMAHDLRNDQDLDPAALLDSMSLRLDELVAGQDRLLVSLGDLGSRQSRLDRADQRLGDLRIQLQGLESEVTDADLSEVVLDMSRAEQTLQVAQATGARLLQQSLLNYLR
jgi:flagellar hook-associated protein 3 FlgL